MRQENGIEVQPSYSPVDLHSRKQNRALTLASASPRRKELLAGLGLSFSVQPSLLEEKMNADWDPATLVQELALQKARDVSQRVQQGIVLGADTIVVLDGNVLGKPVDQDDAFSMLQRLQGREHTVFSGVAIIDVEQNITEVRYSATKVHMRSLTEAEILRYIATEEPMDKAGSYGIQGIGATLIEKVEGDYFTVVGLPLILTAQLLKEFGISVL